MTEEMRIRLREVLFNTAAESGASVDYGKGVIVGVVSTLMSMGKSFGVAYDIMYRCLPKTARLECIPEAWGVSVEEFLADEKGGE